jgi:hypothetical protein
VGNDLQAMKYLILLSLVLVTSSIFCSLRSVIIPSGLAIHLIIFILSKRRETKYLNEGFYPFAYNILIYGLIPFPVVILMVNNSWLGIIYCSILWLSICSFHNTLISSKNTNDGKDQP